MKCEVIHLKDHFAFLGENRCDPVLQTYLPYNMVEMGRGEQKRPCLIVCPGGAYMMCSEREAEVIGVHFLPDGYNVFVLQYSVSPNRFPTQLREVAAVMELIYQNADEWNCDTSRIAIMGFSAGGHLAAHYSNAYNFPEVREVFPESKRVDASVLCYPVITSNEKYAHLGSFENVSGKKVDESVAEKFSCERLVSDDTPPAFIWHTAPDTCVPVENSLMYAAALSANKIPFEMHIYPFGPHGLGTADEQSNNELPQKISRNRVWLDDVRKWLKLMFSLKDN